MDYRDLIKKHEGYRTAVYLDSEGVPTVGWGHAFFGPGAPLPGTPFSKEQCQEFFEDDMQQVERDYASLEYEYGFEKLDYIRRAVLKNMLFNLGLRKLNKFVLMLSALCSEDYAEAAREMLDSRWARQVGRRADRLALMMELGRGYA